MGEHSTERDGVEQEVGWAVLGGQGELAMTVSRREVMGGEGVRGGCSPWRGPVAGRWQNRSVQ